MATVNTLVMEFEGTGSTVKFSYKYADPTITSQEVSALMQLMIANGDIFENPPLTAKSAKLVATTESSYVIS